MRTDEATMRTGQPVRGRAHHGTAVFFGLLLVVVALKVPTLNQPPVWDGSFSVFPAASTLAETGFDYPDLLERPGYRLGGPNVHALSVVTVVTAAAIRWLDGADLALPALHLLNYVLAAAAGTGMYRIASRSLSTRLALLTTLAGLLAPVVLTQAGDVYLELPILVCTVWAAAAFLEDRRPLAAGWAVAGALVKPSAVVIGAALALATLTDLRRDRRDLRSAALAFAAPAGVVLLLVALGPSNGVDEGFLDLVVSTFGSSTRFLLRVPDLVALLLVFLLVRPAVADRPFVGGDDTVEAHRTESFVRSLLVSFAGFSVVAGGLAFTTLPRYWSQVMPFVVLGVALVLRRLASEPVVAVGIGALCVVFVVNLNGLLYPAVGQNNFPVAERSGEYRRLLDVELDVAQAIEALPDDVSVFFTQAHHYWVTYPSSRYVTEAVTNGVNMATDPRREDPHLADFPAELYVAYESSALGGQALADLVAQAQADPSYTVVVTEFRSGEFWSRLVHIERTG